MKQCNHCGYQRKRIQKVKGSSCPNCGFVDRNFAQRLSDALSAFVRAWKDKPYQPRKYPQPEDYYINYPQDTPSEPTSSNSSGETG